MFGLAGNPRCYLVSLIVAQASFIAHGFRFRIFPVPATRGGDTAAVGIIISVKVSDPRFTWRLGIIRKSGVSLAHLIPRHCAC